MMKNLGAIKFYYFPVRGEAHKIRLLLAEAEIPYTEVNVVPHEYMKIKDSLPCKQLPVLEHGDIRLSGPATITRYLGELAKMNGSSQTDRATIDMWCEYIEDTQQKVWSSASPAERKDHILGKQIENNLHVISDQLSKMELPLLVGSKFSRADVMLFSLLDSMSREVPTILTKFKLLSTVLATTRLRPGIEKFLAGDARP